MNTANVCALKAIICEWPGDYLVQHDEAQELAEFLASHGVLVPSVMGDFECAIPSIPENAIRHLERIAKGDA